MKNKEEKEGMKKLRQWDGGGEMNEGQNEGQNEERIKKRMKRNK